MNEDVVRVEPPDARRPAHARGVRAGRGAVPGVVRGAGPGAHGGLAAARGGLHPDPPRVGAHGQAAPGLRTHSAATDRRLSTPAVVPRQYAAESCLRRSVVNSSAGVVTPRLISTDFGTDPYHTFRATGITAYLSNGGTLEHAQQIAGHASPKTTKLYDRTADTITVDEIERIVI